MNRLSTHLRSLARELAADGHLPARYASIEEAAFALDAWDEYADGIDRVFSKFGVSPCPRPPVSAEVAQK